MWDVLLLRSTCQGVTQCNYSIFHMFKVSKPLSTKNLRNFSLYNLILTIAENLFQTMMRTLHINWLNCASPSSKPLLARCHTAARNHPSPKQTVELSFLFLLVGVFGGFCLNLKLLNVEEIVILVYYKALSSLMVPYLFMLRRTILSWSGTLPSGPEFTSTFQVKVKILWCNSSMVVKPPSFGLSTRLSLRRFKFNQHFSKQTLTHYIQSTLQFSYLLQHSKK